MPGRLVYVTGVSRGIGLAMAEACPFHDARIVGVSRTRPPRSPSGVAAFEHVALDLAGPAGWRALAARFAQELPFFDGSHVLLVHAAGTLTPIGFAGEVDPAAYERNVLLNGAAPQVIGDAFLRCARTSPARCDVLFIGSGAARNAYEGWSSYCAGKAAADHWVRTVGAEQRRRGGRSRVLSVAPGVVETAMQAEIRATSIHDFPQRPRFVELFETGALRRSDAVAKELWRLLDTDLENGAVLDLRDLALGG